MNMLKTKGEIESWLIDMGVENYTINKDLTVDVGGGVFLEDKKLAYIPVQFGLVKWSFYCHRNELTSLKGCPHTVGGDFLCFDNKLTSLEGAPSKVKDRFDCSMNQLTSLEFSPQTVDSFDCFSNKLTSLKGGPLTLNGNYNCGDNQLTTLEGAPTKTNDFYCYNNKLTSLIGIPEIINENFDCENNQLKNIQNCNSYICGYTKFIGNTVSTLEGVSFKGPGFIAIDKNQYSKMKSKFSMVPVSINDRNEVCIYFSDIQKFLLKTELDETLSKKIEKTKGVKI